MRTITRWQNGNKVRIETESIPYSANRAKEILDTQRNGNLTAVMSDGEIAYTYDLWDTMPGNTCFYDAVCRIYQGKDSLKENKAEYCDMCEPYQTHFGKGFIRNAGQIIPCFQCNSSKSVRKWYNELTEARRG